MPVLNSRIGFTLIELLIVMAIIGILAAIGIPSYLQAKSTSEVARAQAEMRNISVGLESYFVDHGAYPLAANDTLTPYPVGPLEGYLPASLTTPISYISALQPDIFRNDIHPIPLPFRYSESRTNAFLGTPDFLNHFWYAVYAQGSFGETRYVMFSHGPDMDHDRMMPHVYDPSNGSLSSGDIYFWGPGIGLNE